MAEAVEVRPAAYHLVMGSFDGVETAVRVTKELKAEGVLAGCEIEGEATVSHEADGSVHVHEKGGAGTGAAAGATTAGVIGLVGGPVVLPLMLVAGALAGGIAGHFIGQVLPREDLREVAESLPRGSSATVLLVDSRHARAVADALRPRAARVLDIPIETELSCAIREGVTHRIHRV